MLPTFSEAQRKALEILTMQAISTLDLLESSGMTVTEFRQLFRRDLLVDTGRISEYRSLDAGEVNDIMWIANFKKVEELGL